MKLPISQRLLACCAFVHPGDRVADIGCDHGYLGIHLLTNGIASSVIAADIRESPLQSAIRNAKKYGVSENIRFFLSDGVKTIPRDFDTLVCAGMGADVMISILEAAPWLQQDSYRLILQCQSRTHQLREYLSRNGWHIRQETVLKDGRFLYTVMEVIRQPGQRLSPGECFVTPALLQSRSPQLPEYIRWVTEHLEITVRGQKDKSDSFLQAALTELQNCQIKEGI